MALLSAGAVCAIAMALIPWIHSPERVALAPALISSTRGAAHFVRLSDNRSVLGASRDPAALFPAPMQILQNEGPVGLLANGFDEVVEKGGGRFAYQHPVLAFSTPDGSDPRINGRAYVLERPVKARLLAWFVAGIAVLIGTGLAFPDWIRSTSIALLRVGAGPDARRGTQLAALAVTLLIVIAGLLLMWWGNASTHFGVASFLPVSDALGYYKCAVWIGAIDPQNVATSLSDWCARRILYPSMLSSVLGLSGWRPSIALMLQAMTIGASAGVLLLALRRTFGWVTAIATAAGVLVLARDFALGSFVTEAFGLPAGLVALALLLLAVRDRELVRWLLLLGLTILSVGMAVRAGAVFALPLLLLWVFVITRSVAARSRVKLLLLALAATAAGPLLQYAIVVSAGADPANSGGNFSASLYGLSTGSRDWSQAYRDFADVFSTKSETVAFQTIHQAALERIVRDPVVFVGSLAAAAKAFAKSLFTFGSLPPYNTLATWLFCFGLLLCVRHYRRPAPFLLLVLCAGEFMSAPFVYDSGGHRVLAVTVAARIAVAAYGVAWLLGLLVRELRSVPPPSASAVIAQDRLPIAVASALGLILLGLAIAPATPIASAWRLAPISAAKACSADQLEVIARPGRESMRMTFGVRSLPLNDEELGSVPGALEFDPIGRQAWWARELISPPRGTEIIYAVQRDRQNLGGIVAAFSRVPLAISNDDPHIFCLARQASAEVKIGDLTAHEILSIVGRAR